VKRDGASRTFHVLLCLATRQISVSKMKTMQHKSPSAKIIQVYSGYGILLTVVLNIIFYGQEPYATPAFWANWAFVAIHLVISVRC
jgi:multidrug transporter EmrE-like cation transporter